MLGPDPISPPGTRRKSLPPEGPFAVLRERGLCSVFLPGESASSQYGGMGHVSNSES